jgi:chromosome segregation ATPase
MSETDYRVEYHKLLAAMMKHHDALGWDGTNGVNFIDHCKQVVADRDRLAAELPTLQQRLAEVEGEAEHWRLHAKMMARAADTEKSERIVVTAQRDLAIKERDEAREAIGTCKTELARTDKDLARARRSCDSYVAELSRYRPVIEAAKAWREADEWDMDMPGAFNEHLRRADALRAAISSALTPAAGEEGEK